MAGRQEVVREALHDTDGFRSAQDVYARLRATGTKIGLTTVYRALQTLSEAGEVDVLHNADGESVYRACRTAEHHHHLVCRRCGRAVEVSGPPVERWAERTAAEHGFTDIGHTVEVFGLCPDCATGPSLDRD